MYNESHGITGTAKGEIITVTTFLWFLAILAVALRVYAQVYSELYLGVDNYTIIIALVRGFQMTHHTRASRSTVRETAWVASFLQNIDYGERHHPLCIK